MSVVKGQGDNLHIKKCLFGNNSALKLFYIVIQKWKSKSQAKR